MQNHWLCCLLLLTPLMTCTLHACSFSVMQSQLTLCGSKLMMTFFKRLHLRLLRGSVHHLPADPHWPEWLTPGWLSWQCVQQLSWVTSDFSVCWLYKSDSSNTFLLPLFFEGNMGPWTVSLSSWKFSVYLKSALSELCSYSTGYLGQSPSPTSLLHATLPLSLRLHEAARLCYLLTDRWIWPGVKPPCSKRAEVWLPFLWFSSFVFVCFLNRSEV